MLLAANARGSEIAHWVEIRTGVFSPRVKLRPEHRQSLLSQTRATRLTSTSVQDYATWLASGCQAAHQPAPWPSDQVFARSLFRAASCTTSPPE